MIMFIHFFRLCPPDLTIKLNFNLSKVAYCSWTKTHSDKCKVQVKSAFVPSGSSDQRVSWFLQHEATESISTPPWMGCQSIAGLSSGIKFPGIHIYTWVKRGTVRVSCPRTQDHVPGQGSKPDRPESSALTMRPRTARRISAVNI